MAHTTQEDEPQEQEKCDSKLGSSLGKLKVLTDDLMYLMRRAEIKSLSSVDEHLEVIEEIHEAQRILADCEAFAQSRIAAISAHNAVAKHEAMQKANEQIAHYASSKPAVSRETVREMRSFLDWLSS